MTIQFSVENVTSLLDNEVPESLDLVLRMANITDEWNVTTENLNKNTNSKKDLANCLSNMTDAVLRCRDDLKGALALIDQMKSDQISFQKRIIELQEEVIAGKSDQLSSVQATVKDTVQTTVKTELNSYSEAVLKGPSNSVTTITQQQIKNAVKSAVKEDDRSKNMMLFGITEETGENLEKIVQEVCEKLDEKPVFTSECVRVGVSKKPGYVRPVKVSMRSSETVKRILSKAKQLKETANFNKVFLSYDRTKEERLELQKLVIELKQIRKDDPERQHFIRNNKICSQDK